VCGIVGVFDSGGSLPPPERFSSCMDRLQRRGPDDAGTWSNSVVRLGHRRLAIVDLSPTGHQPMVSADGRFVIVFNGEIYNHAELRPQLEPPGGWAGTSDTETLLEAYRRWGQACLGRLNGMFAFAIWDNTERRLFVARDRLGVKPLYYSWHDGRFVFASRPSAMTGLLAGGAEIDPQSLRVFMELGYIPAPLSFYRKIRKLPPGHCMTVDARGPRAMRYWDYRHIAPDPKLLERSESELIDEFDDLMRQATRLRLMSDVPLGAFLSGGVDSAYVVAAMKAVGVAAPNAFTIAFSEPEYNEGPAAMAIARHVGVEHVVETLSVGDLLGLLPLYVDEFDEPFADSSAFPTMAVARLARRHVEVALTGDAGDELFGGYHYYPLIEALSKTRSWPAGIRRLAQASLGLLPLHRAKLLAGALGPTTLVGIFNYLRSFSKDFSPLVSDSVLSSTDSSSDWFERTALGFPKGLTSAEVGMRLDLGLTLVDQYLQKVDVATMALSLEARSPFLDYRMVEWSMRLPVEYKIRGRNTKYLLKKALCRYLPPELVYRPKRGFGVPVAQWLRGPLRAWAMELLHDDTLIARVPLEKARLRQLFDLHDSGARDAHPLLWATLMLLCYVARHDQGISLPAIATQRAAAA
jgi:asparagine synthase (glutamine-hydrolysing)